MLQDFDGCEAESETEEADAARRVGCRRRADCGSDDAGAEDGADVGVVEGRG